MGKMINLTSEPGKDTGTEETAKKVVDSLLNDMSNPEKVIREFKPAEPVKTLRDEFAMAALNGIMSHEYMMHPPNTFRVNAMLAYKYADAMMEARNEEQRQDGETKS
jgi:hypothetical protein